MALFETCSPVLPIVTLTTDFGTTDGYAAAMKGVILEVVPEARLVDLTHEVAAQDIMNGGWILRQAVPYFPQRAVHLAVVDPGVGSPRRAIACRIAGRTFVGPDNGLFSLLLGDDALGPDAVDELVVLDRPALWRTPSPAATFHGRDLFAPVAAHLAAGSELADVGTLAEPASLTRLHWVQPRADSEGVQGWVVHIDRFGNAITNITSDLIEHHARGRTVRCYAGTTILDGINQTYSDAEAGEPLALIGSTGHLEVGVNGGDAATLLSLTRGSSVNVVFGERLRPRPLLRRT